MPPTIKPQPSLGRPPNPYIEANHYFTPGATRGWFAEGADLAAPAPEAASIMQRDLRWWAYGLIMQMGIPVVRRVIESILVFDHGFEPEAVTSALDRLHRRDYIGGRHIVLTEIPSRSDKPQKIFTYKRRPTSAELAYLSKAIAKRDRLLSKEALRDAGERYVRALMLKSRCFTDVPQRSRLGRLRDHRGRNALDLIVTSRSTGIMYGISVKNQREWLGAGAVAIADCYHKAEAHGARPWLVVPFATKAAVERCDRDKIRLTVLDRQIVPATVRRKRTRELIENLRYVIGPQPFEYLYTREDRTFSESAKSQADVRNLIEMESRR